MPKTEPNRCVRWLRDTLDFTQVRLGTLIGATQPTVQSIETGRLPLSEAFAFALERTTGIAHRWLLANDLDAPPVTPAGAPWTPECFTLAQGGGFAGYEQVHLIARVQLLRTYVLLRGIVDELGYKGTQASGFNATLQKAVLDLLATLRDKKVRERVYSEALKITSVPGNEATLKLILSDAKDLLRFNREWTKGRAAEHAAAAERFRLRKATAAGKQKRAEGGQ